MSSEVIDMAQPIVTPDREVATVRDPVIDVARGIAIVLVVLGHNSAINRWSPASVDILFLFHVPLFFLLSGYVLRQGPFVPAVAKFARRLLVPCFAAAFLVGAAKCVSRDGSFVEMLVGLAWATGQTLPWSHLWFLPTLFLALLLTQLAGYMFGERPLAWAAGVAIAMAIAAFALQPVVMTLEGFSFAYPVGLPWGIDVLAHCLVFVFLGRLLRSSPWIARGVRSLPVAMLAAVAFAWATTVANVDINMRIFTPFIASMLAAACGCILAINAAALICRSMGLARAFAFLGRHTLPIFLLHVSIQKALLRLGATYEMRIGDRWLTGVLTATVAMLAAVMLERYVIARIKPLRYLFMPERAT